jgi:carbonic anhydrase
VRNVGNMMPPPGSDASCDSVAAAVEYAVEVLEVSSITVCGHSGCGAMQALLASSAGGQEPGALTPLARWLRHGRPSLARMARTYGTAAGTGTPLGTAPDTGAITTVDTSTDLGTSSAAATSSAVAATATSATATATSATAISTAFNSTATAINSTVINSTVVPTAISTTGATAGIRTGTGERSGEVVLAERPVADDHERLSLVNIVQQLDHLTAHPCVARRVREGTLHLHGMYFHVGEAQAYILDRATGVFNAVRPDGAPQPPPAAAPATGPGTYGLTTKV